MDKFFNIFDYIEFRGDLSLKERPFNEVDNLILSMLSYVNYDGIVEDLSKGFDNALSLRELVEKLKELPNDKIYMGVIIPYDIVKLAYAIADTERFSDMKICCFENQVSEKTNMQFAAVTFILPDDTVFISYRGTDDTLVGWKEDFHMMFESPLPSQIKAETYLGNIAEMHKGNLRLGGHSKGGNLSIWAAVTACSQIRNRIINVYCNDGPGFSSYFYKKDGYKDLYCKITKLVPDSSVVGIAFEENNEYEIICSREKNFYQHDPFSWEIKRDRFVRKQQLSAFGQKTDDLLKKWLASMSVEERRFFTDTIFDILASTKAKTLTELNSAKMKSAAIAAHTMRNMDKDNRKKIILFLRRFVMPEKD